MQMGSAATPHFPKLKARPFPLGCLPPALEVGRLLFDMLCFETDKPGMLCVVLRSIGAVDCPAAAAVLIRGGRGAIHVA
jgi:hypothetical protein